MANYLQGEILQFKKKKTQQKQTLMLNIGRDLNKPVSFIKDLGRFKCLQRQKQLHIDMASNILYHSVIISKLTPINQQTSCEKWSLPLGSLASQLQALNLLMSSAMCNAEC